MANELISFQWEVYEGGYRLLEGERRGARETALIENVPPPPEIDLSFITGGEPEPLEQRKPPSPYRLYSPLRDHTGLFLVFAALPLTTDAVCGFASVYGRLGIGVNYDRLGNDEPPYDREVNAEPVEWWRQFIVTMKAAVDLWDLLRKGGTAEDRIEDAVRLLARHDDVFEGSGWGPVPGVWLRGGLDDLRDAPSRNALDHIEQRDWRAAGHILVQQMLHVHVRAHTATAVTQRPDGSGLELTITPKNLLGALWLQFAQAVTGNLQHRRCKEESCGQWFEVSKRNEGKNKNCEYCSLNCRMKSYRRRQKQARRMAAEGQSVEGIAGQLGSEVSTIRDWIGPRLRVVR